MAAPASLSVPFGAESTTSPVAGLITLYVCPEFEPTGSPAMNILAMASPLFCVHSHCSCGLGNSQTATVGFVAYFPSQTLSTCSIVHRMERESVLLQIGRKVRARRTSMGWTLKEIAERSGISPRFLCDLEAGKGNISVARLADLAEALDVPIISLMSTDEEAKRVVALVGLRGAGKSTVGKALAKHLGVRFIELDALIESDTNLVLGELFSLHGEAYYKRRAYDLLVKLFMENEPMVVATGGSIVTDPETWQLLKRRTHTVWLKASPENHWKRVLGQGDTRPMANRTSAMAELRSILSLRSPLYAEATQMIDTNSVRVTGAVRMIAEALTDRENGHRETQTRAKRERDSAKPQAISAASIKRHKETRKSK